MQSHPFRFLQDTQGHFHVFVGDLSPEVNDEVLQKAFGAFGTLSDARVMWDMSSGQSPFVFCPPQRVKAASKLTQL